MLSYVNKIGVNKIFIREISDLHLEFEVYNNSKRHYPDRYFSLPVLDTDSETVLILAGDIALIDRPYMYVPMLEEMSTRFKAVIYVCGNHEFYHYSVKSGYHKLRQEIQHTGTFLLQNDKIKIDDVTFIGATLWTDFNKHNYSDMVSAQMGLADFKFIRTGTAIDPHLRKLRPADVVSMHLDSVAYIESVLTEVKLKNDEKAVVVTHHAPSYQSIHPMYYGDPYNACYYSDLDGMVLKYEPELWFHGHMHNSFNYHIGRTNIICNPRGYTPKELNKDFNPLLLLEI